MPSTTPDASSKNTRRRRPWRRTIGSTIRTGIIPIIGISTTTITTTITIMTTITDTSRPPTTTITLRIRADILAGNAARASAVRARLDRAGVLALNLMSSPGAGKTRLLEVTAAAFGARRMAVIEGDLETENDARRLRGRGVRAEQITTGWGCHLDARMIDRGLDRLDLDGVAVVFVENVGNLVCPADFDLGQHLNVVLLSVTEGDDKPEKYPPIFHCADLVLITKTDLLGALDDFDLARAEAAIGRVRPGVEILRCSARSGDGMDAWRTWLEARLADLRGRADGARCE